jgi:regulator of protease activity HflC (stomatin/prohibitin superfamily)
MGDLGSLGVGLLVILVLALVLLNLSMKVVGQGQAMVVFRMGKATAEWVRGPGLQFLVPIIWRPVLVDMREQSVEVPTTATTRDGATLSVDFVITWKIVDPLKSVVNVAVFAGALRGVATTTLRAIIGDILLEEALTKRVQITEVLRTKLDEVADRWGGTVIDVEIREITPTGNVTSGPGGRIAGARTADEILAEIGRDSRPESDAGH